VAIILFSHLLQDIPPVPWRELAKSVPLWGLIFAQVGHDWGWFTLVTDLPKYFKDVMRFNIFEVSKLVKLVKLVKPGNQY
jgi:ACS family sodium-dependent inorganic phosphate cotransporter